MIPSRMMPPPAVHALAAVLRNRVIPPDLMNDFREARRQPRPQFGPCSSIDAPTLRLRQPHREWQARYASGLIAGAPDFSLSLPAVWYGKPGPGDLETVTYSAEQFLYPRRKSEIARAASPPRRASRQEGIGAETRCPAQIAYPACAISARAAASSVTSVLQPRRAMAARIATARWAPPAAMTMWRALARSSSLTDITRRLAG